MKRKIVEEKAYELLKELSIKTIPTPLDEIAKHFNITIQEDDFEGDISGVLFRDPDENQTIIGVNSRHFKQRQNFTIAHELGHFMLHEGNKFRIDRNFRVNFRDNNSSQATDFEEIEANAFAAALLMPENKVREVVKKKLKEGIDLEDSKELEKMASQFGVSEQALLIRLVKLGYIEDLML